MLLHDLTFNEILGKLENEVSDYGNAEKQIQKKVFSLVAETCLQFAKVSIIFEECHQEKYLFTFRFRILFNFTILVQEK